MATVAEDSVIKVAALSGSLRKASYNEGLIIRAAAEAFRQEILEADSTLVASPEHNYPVFDTVSFHEVLSIYE
uniref:NAD(P)H dehydrogenase (quinone) n=1 Tax=Populus trichocarpa TaxID=3694 RepID=B9GWZ0_POPTR